MFIKGRKHNWMISVYLANRYSCGNIAVLNDLTFSKVLMTTEITFQTSKPTVSAHACALFKQTRGQQEPQIKHVVTYYKLATLSLLFVHKTHFVHNKLLCTTTCSGLVTTPILPQGYIADR